MDDKEKGIFEQMPSPPEGVAFHLVKVGNVSMPHPYCITPKHVAWASDHHSGMLTKDAIREAEKKDGARCDICAKSGRGILSIDDHESMMTLFIKVPRSDDLNKITGLHAYLLSIKEKAEALGIQSFAFPS